MKIKIFITIILVSIITDLSAQDYFLTQNTTSQQLSPSFAGINQRGRLTLGAKDSPAMQLYRTLYLGYDQYFDKINSGFGLFVVQDEGADCIGINEFMFNYTYQFNITKNIFVRPAIGLNLRNDFIDFPKLVFGDQINSDGGTAPSSTQVPPIPSIFNFDFASSVLIYGSSFWAGLTANHLAHVSNSMYDYEIYLKPKYNIFGGYKYIIEESVNEFYEKSAVLTANYSTNFTYDYLDLRAYINWNIITFALGMRNSIIADYNAESYSIIAIAGINIKNIKIGYSYDWGIFPNLNYHEISLSYLIPEHEKVSKDISK